MTLPLASKPKHRLLFELGRGGMGTVFLAVLVGGPSDGALRVVKHLRGDLALQPSFLKSFLDEAKLSMRLSHPNVVATHDVGFDGTHYFLEMEYLEGQTLDALSRKLPAASPPPGEDDAQLDLPRPLALFVLGEILAALHYAHELTDESGAPLRVVHRDVSPHNVVVTCDGDIKLLDFGIAKAADSSAGDTTTGVVKGKLAYMSPEQATRGPVDRRADLFAVGVMLWQFLTRRRLWQGVPEPQIFHKLDHGEIPSAREVRSDVPPSLDAICTKALARVPAERYATAAEMQAALAAAAEELGEAATKRDLASRMDSLFAREREETRARTIAQVRGGTEPGVAGPATLAAAAARARTSDGVSDTRSAPRDTPMPFDQAPARAAKRRWLLVGVAAAALALAGGVWRLRPRLGATGTPGGSASAEIVAAPRCQSSAACVRANGGAPFVCRRADGACVALATPACKVLAEREDIENDATIWLGAMFPTSGGSAEQFGNESVNAADLARRDFMTIARGIPYVDPERAPRPLGLVVCDDAKDPLASARHLVGDVGVPAIVGFNESQEVIDLAGSVFVPNGVLAMASQNQSPLLATIPRPAGAPRMVWRTTVSSSQSAVPVAALLSQWIEPLVKPTLGAKEPMRVLLLRAHNTGGLSISDTYFNQLRWNGKSALENGSAYHDAAFDFPTTDARAVITEVLSFKPHVVLIPGVTGIAKDVLTPIEDTWPAGTPKPYYLVGGYVVGDDFFAFLGKSAERRRRFLGVTPSSSTVANAKLMIHYNERFSPKVPRAATPGAVYDAMYAVAYGIFALGDEPITGRALAQRLPRFSGTTADARAPLRFDVGPTRIFDVLAALRSGEAVDLDGAATRMDFDPATGDTSADFAVLCVDADHDGKAHEAVESNVIYSSTTRRLEGLPLRCR